MPTTSVNDAMQSVFRNVFNEPELRLSDDLTAAQVPGWDSLAHVGLMFSLEAEFAVTFTDSELSRLDNVGQLRQVIESKLNPRPGSGRG
jgi:acyl carrier protein